MEEPEGPLSRAGSLKKSASFNQRNLVDVKKISFDEDEDIEQFNADNEPIAAAKQIFAAIANTSLDAGLSGRKSRSRDSSRDRLGQIRSANDFSPAEPAEYFSPNESEFGNEDELMLIIDSNDGQESQYTSDFRDMIEHKTASLPKMGKLSNRRNSDDKYPKSVVKSRSGSNVPELEPIEGFMAGNRSRSSSGGRRFDFNPEGSEPVSTGATSLDEFERRLAEMEMELDEEMVETDHITMEKYETQKNIMQYETRESYNVDWNNHVEQADHTDFSTIAAEFKASVSQEEIYAKIIPKSKRLSQILTDDGFVINKERELNEVDHSEWTNLEPGEDEDYKLDLSTGEKLKRVKKISFAEADETFEIQRDSDMKTNAFTKLFSLAQKPSKNSSSTTFENVHNNDFLAPPFMKQESKEPSPSFQHEINSPKAFIAAMTGGLLGNRSPDVNKKNQSSSVFGSLLR